MLKVPVRTLATLTLLVWLPSQPATAQLFDWRAASAGASTYQLSADGVTAIGTAYVAELTAGNPVLGPFSTSTGSLASGFNQDADGIGLFATPSATSALIAGTENCCGLVLGGINSDPYLDGNTSIEAMNFVVFEFSAAVSLNTLEVVGVSNQARGVWIATGSGPPDLTGGIEQALTGFSVFNLPDDTGSTGLLTHTFNSTADFQYMFIGAPPSQPVGPIAAVAGGTDGSNFRIRSMDSAAGPAVPAMGPIALGLLVACMLLLGLRHTSAA